MQLKIKYKIILMCHSAANIIPMCHSALNLVCRCIATRTTARAIAINFRLFRSAGISLLCLPAAIVTAQFVETARATPALLRSAPQEHRGTRARSTLARSRRAAANCVLASGVSIKPSTRLTLANWMASARHRDLHAPIGVTGSSSSDNISCKK